MLASQDPKPFGAAINACSKSSQWKHASALLEVAEAAEVSMGPIGVNTVMGACSRSQKWREALHLFSTATAPDLTTFNTAIAACARAKSWQQSLLLLEDIPRRKLARDTFSFNSAMSGLAGSRWVAGIALLELMVSEQVAPDTVTYNSLMDVAPQKAPEIFRQMLREEAARSFLSLSLCLGCGGFASSSLLDTPR